MPAVTFMYIEPELHARIMGRGFGKCGLLFVRGASPQYGSYSGVCIRVFFILKLAFHRALRHTNAKNRVKLHGKASTNLGPAHVRDQHTPKLTKN